MDTLKQKIFDEFLNKEGFIKDNNIILEELELNHSKISMVIEQRHLNPSKIVHGGIIFSLADTAMGIAARTNDSNVVTVNAQIDYLRPAKTSKLYATAESIRVGHKVAVYKTEIKDENDKLVAVCTGTFFFIENKEF